MKPAVDVACEPMEAVGSARGDTSAKGWFIVDMVFTTSAVYDVLSAGEVFDG